MRVFLAAAVMALLAGTACAQGQDIVPKYGDEDKTKTPHQIEADKEAERAYKRSLGNIPDRGTTTDPWGNMRSDGAPKPVAKAAPAKRTKAGNVAN